MADLANKETNFQAENHECLETIVQLSLNSHTLWVIMLKLERLG